uniref:Major capsid protein N-terminal domain-containing protein n=1 Tax=viral metagenome TaxID=1070528 RepID=A0A6C0I8P9_9ZZZZ
MGGGLLQLVAYGAQDVYLTGNPQITFFKVVYRRHTNFAIEAIQQTPTGSNSLGSRVSFQITRNGDLIHRVYFYGKIAATGDVALVPNFGHKLLKTIELEIGGQRIDKHYSEWLYIWNELSLPIGKRDGYNVMVGANGRNIATKLTTGAKYELYVPLEFWFCRNVGLALPLIALQYHEVKINIEYESDVLMIDKTATNFTIQEEERTIASNMTYLANDQLTGSVKLEEATLWVDYIFLDTDERRRFAQLSHEYLIEQLQFTGADSITGGTTDSMKSIRMNFNHPCKELVWTIKKTDAGVYWNNYSTAGGTSVANNDHLDSANPVTNAKIMLNGNDRFATRKGDYFSLVQPYQHHENTPDKYHQGINVYSFALKPEEHQPSGTLNMSRIDTAVLSLSSTISGVISIYAVNYNVLRILSGMGGLAYSN